MLQQIRNDAEFGLRNPVNRDVAPGSFFLSSDVARRGFFLNRCGAGVILPVVRCTPAGSLGRLHTAHGLGSICRSNYVAHRPPVWFRSTIEAQSAVSSRPVRRTGHGISRIWMFGRIIASQLLTAASTHGIDVLAYCLMPDHAHVLLEAHAPTESVFETFVEWKHRAALLAWRRRDVRLWQESSTTTSCGLTMTVGQWRPTSWLILFAPA